MTSASRAVMAAALAASILGLPPPARANDNHFQDYITGDRALGLGGAFTAISNDSSGGYYNPAGLAETPKSSVSLAASVYGWAQNDWQAPTIQLQSGNANFITYPTTAAWIQRVRKGDKDGVGRVQLSLSLLTPRSNINRRRLTVQESDIPSDDFNEPASMSQLTAITRIAEDDTLWIGVSAAWKVLRRLSLGLTLFVTHRSAIYQEQGVTVLRYFREPTGEEVARVGLTDLTNVELSHFALLGMLGVVVPITDQLRFGASFRSPSIELSGKAEFSLFNTRFDKDTRLYTLQETLAEDGVTFHSKEPLKATVGLAYILPRAWGVALDFAIHGPVGEYAVFESDAFPTLQQRLRMKKKVVWQLNVGGEYYIVGKVPVRAGFFTNRSSYAPTEGCSALDNCAGGNFLNDTLDMYGFAASVGFELEAVALNLGASYSFGGETSTRTFQDAQGDSISLDLTHHRSYLLISIGGMFRF